MPIKNEYRNPDLLKRIYRLKVEGMSDSKVAEKIGEEFNVPIFRTTVKNLYNQYVKNAEVMASIIPEEKKGEEIIDWNSRMREKFKRIDDVTTTLLDKIVEAGENLPPEQYIKLAPALLATCREILNQLDFLKKEQEKLRLEQKKATYSPLQIMQVIDNEKKISKKKEKKMEEDK